MVYWACMVCLGRYRHDNMFSGYCFHGPIVTNHRECAAQSYVVQLIDALGVQFAVCDAVRLLLHACWMPQGILRAGVTCWDLNPRLEA